MRKTSKESLIIHAIESYGTEIDVLYKIQENIYSYVEDSWEEDGEYESEEDWYQDFGKGEAEGEIHQEILQVISEALDEPIDNWYFNNKYGDIDTFIYEVFPMLETP